jgi:hypothetical protein
METAEYLKEIKKYIEVRIRENIRQGVEVSERIYLDQALAHAKQIYQNNSSRKRFVWNRNDMRSMVEIWESISPELEEFISGAIMKYKSRRMVAEINAVSAEALVAGVMKDAGLKFLFIPQMYRAKVCVKINEKSKIVIYLNYKKINEELPKAVEALKILISTIDSLGPGTSIQKIMWYENF